MSSLEQGALRRGHQAHKEVAPFNTTTVSGLTAQELTRQGRRAVVVATPVSAST